MKNAFILQSRYRDGKGRPIIEILGVYVDLGRLLDAVPLTNKPTEAEIMKGLEAGGLYLMTNTTRLHYDIYLTELYE